MSQKTLLAGLSLQCFLLQLIGYSSCILCNENNLNNTIFVWSLVLCVIYQKSALIQEKDWREAISWSSGGYLMINAVFQIRGFWSPSQGKITFTQHQSQQHCLKDKCFSWFAVDNCSMPCLHSIRTGIFHRASPKDKPFCQLTSNPVF